MKKFVLGVVLVMMIRVEGECALGEINNIKTGLCIIGGKQAYLWKKIDG